MLSCQHGNRKAAILVEVQRPMQLFAAGAGNAVDIAIGRQKQRADALVGMKPYQCSAQARQAIDLLIGAQFHVIEAPVLLSPVVAKERVCAEPSHTELPLAGQRCADKTALATEPSLASAARNAGNL